MPTASTKGTEEKKREHTFIRCVFMDWGLLIPIATIWSENIIISLYSQDTWGLRVLNN